jgi:hypothetical protein
VPGNNEPSVVLSLSLQLDRLRTPHSAYCVRLPLSVTLAARPVYPHCCRPVALSQLGSLGPQAVIVDKAIDAITPVEKQITPMHRGGKSAR